MRLLSPTLHKLPTHSRSYHFTKVIIHIESATIEIHHKNALKKKKLADLVIISDESEPSWL